MKKDDLIDKILSDLYMNSNRAMDFYDDFCVYENDINKLDDVKATLEKEGLIKDYKNLKTGITPLGFKICFEGGYLEDKIKRERQIKNIIIKNKREIAFLRKKLKTKIRVNILLTILLLSGIALIFLIALGIVNIETAF